MVQGSEEEEEEEVSSSTADGEADVVSSIDAA
jgi:hypothetical protein